jgi:hypothetical protein
MPTLDDEIARHLREALESGELQRAKGFGKPLPETEGWDDTPEELRMAFKILKDAGVAPPEIELFHERARVRAALEACTDEAGKERLRGELSQLEQKIALRLESLRGNARL